jgi:hypothetical protein
VCEEEDKQQRAAAMPLGFSRYLASCVCVCVCVCVSRERESGCVCEREDGSSRLWQCAFRFLDT